MTSHYSEETHPLIMENLGQISTEYSLVESLKNPQAEDYQQKWELFFQKYHKAIIRHIMRIAKWPDQLEYQAEDIASLVYERGLRWSFQKIEHGVRFRHVLMQLVRQAFIEYNKNLQKYQCQKISEEFLQLDDSFDVSYFFKKEILETIADSALESYDTLERFVIKTIRNTGKIPSTKLLVSHWNISLESAKKRRHRAKEQWNHLWKQYQQKILDAISEITYGELAQAQETEALQKL